MARTLPISGSRWLGWGDYSRRIGSYNEAIEPLDRAVALYEHLGSAGTVYMVDALSARAELLRQRGDRRGALEESRRAFAVLRDRMTAQMPHRPGQASFSAMAPANCLRRTPGC